MYGGPNEADVPFFPTFSKIIGVFFILAVIAFLVLVFVTFSALYVQTPLLEERSLFYEYQTFIAGMFALLGAVLTIWALNRERRDRILRGSRASKAAMVFALSGICDYAEAYVEYVHSLHRESTNHRFDEMARFPTPPLEAINVLRDCIEYTSNEWYQYLAGLLGEIQVAHSRLERARRPYRSSFRPSPRFCGQQKEHAARIYGMAERLFPYARGEIEKPAYLEPIKTNTLSVIMRRSGIRVSD